MLYQLRITLEYIGGSTDIAPEFLRGRVDTAVRCAVWIGAILLIYAFCGQSSKFIYLSLIHI